MRTSVSFAMGLALCGAAGAAFAETLEFTYTSSDNGSASWTQSSTPVVIYSDYTTTDVVVTNGTETNNNLSGNFTDVFFSNTHNIHSGFATDVTPGVGDFGAVLFTGPVTSPSFATGTYTLHNGALTVTAVPEPAAWLMMLLGVAGVGGIMRSRRRRAIAAALPV
jgi:hypothetical protein